MGFLILIVICQPKKSTESKVLSFLISINYLTPRIYHLLSFLGAIIKIEFNKNRWRSPHSTLTVQLSRCSPCAHLDALSISFLMKLWSGAVVSVGYPLDEFFYVISHNPQGSSSCRRWSVMSRVRKDIVAELPRSES